MFRRILVAFDGSAHAKRALTEATELAQANEGSVTVISAVPEPSSWIMGGPYAPPVNVEELEQEVEASYRKQLNDAAEGLATGIDVSTVLVHGPAGPAIIRQIEQGRHDLVVLGSRGRGEVRALFLGSVSQHVSHASPVPVLIVHAEPEG